MVKEGFRASDKRVSSNHLGNGKGSEERHSRYVSVIGADQLWQEAERAGDTGIR